VSEGLPGGVITVGGITMKEKELKFEDAMKRLEKIVQELEDGNIGLEESLKKYQEGVGLSQFCTKKLNEAQKTVQILSKKGTGRLEAEPFEEREVDSRE
jgi:exodeoxyribonuclease VII small subunit